MRTLIRRLHRSLAFIEDWSLFLAVSLALVVAMANVVLRKLTSDVNLYWSDEVVRKVIFFSTYVGCIAAIRHRSLIRIDALPQLFPVLRKPLVMVNHLAVLTFAGMMVWFGFSLMQMVYQDQFAKTASLQIPEWYFYAVLPLVGAMMFVRTLIVAVEDWFGLDLSSEPLAEAGGDGEGR
ncbi:MAG: TRAP transporter small permease [Desulfuromonadales bacterium]|nr:TRAP transporter small permease [Desulfuromonadales bacterium]